MESISVPRKRPSETKFSLGSEHSSDHPGCRLTTLLTRFLTAEVTTYADGCLDDPGPVGKGTGSQATSRAYPTSPQHLQRFPEAPSTLWPAWELPDDYELPAQREETKLVKLVRR